MRSVMFQGQFSERAIAVNPDQVIAVEEGPEKGLSNIMFASGEKPFRYTVIGDIADVVFKLRNAT